MKSIGLLGGTFNPIHYGHLRPALEALEAYDLEKILLIPSSVPPHKAWAADPQDRLAMTELAAANRTEFEVSDVELKREGPSYTIDTIGHFKSGLPRDTRLYFLVGLDAFLEIDTWKHYKHLMEAVPFIVMARPGPKQAQMVKAVGSVLRERISDQYQLDQYQLESENRTYIHPEKPRVHVLKATLMDISATQIREQVKNGRSITFLLPEKVEEYINEKGLYK